MSQKKESKIRAVSSEPKLASSSWKTMSHKEWTQNVSRIMELAKYMTGESEDSVLFRMCELLLFRMQNQYDYAKRPDGGLPIQYVTRGPKEEIRHLGSRVTKCRGERRIHLKRRYMRELDVS